MRLRLLALLVLTTASALPAGAKGPSDRRARTWTESLVAIDAAILAGDHAGASEELDSLLRHVVRTAVDGPGEPALFGKVLALRAVVRAAKEDRAGAEYWWWAAQQVWPEATSFDLERFGDIGLAVRDLGAPVPPPEPHPDDERENMFTLADGQRVSRDRIVQPKLLDRPIPELVPANIRASSEHEVVVRVVLDASGRVTRPILKDVDDLGQSVAWLDAISKWRYQPALLDGKPHPFPMATRYKIGALPPARSRSSSSVRGK